MQLPFGILSSPAIWQKFKEQVLGGINSICVILHDVLVASKKDVELLHNLEEIFNKFIKYGLCLKKENLLSCNRQSNIMVCVYQKRKYISLTKVRVDAIQNAPHPSNITEFCSFLGLLAALTQKMFNEETGSFIDRITPLTSLFLGHTEHRLSSNIDSVICPLWNKSFTEV